MEGKDGNESLERIESLVMFTLHTDQTSQMGLTTTRYSSRLRPLVHTSTSFTSHVIASSWSSQLYTGCPWLWRDSGQDVRTSESSWAFALPHFIAPHDVKQRPLDFHLCSGRTAVEPADGRHESKLPPHNKTPDVLLLKLYD